ncbi:Uncharacterised protein [Cytobacillus firmus]|nr:Uncharacterised protein [Cytobacillus firmus]
MFVSATGKNGETYYTQCKDKEELKEWLAEHEDKLNKKELKVTDKKRHPLLSWLNF